MTDDFNNDDVVGENKENEIDFYYLMGVFFRYKIVIVTTTFLFGLLSIIYVLFAPKIYVSQVSLYPITKDQGGPLKELSVSLGLGTKPEGYYLPDVLESRRISKKVIYRKYKTKNFKDSMNLLQFWNLDKSNVSKNIQLEIALQKLRSAIEIKEDKETTLISMKVYSTDMELSRDIANFYCVATTKYLQEELKTSISSSIVFTKNRLIEAEKSLFAAENILIEFQESNTKISSPSLLVVNKRMYFKVELAKNVVSLLERQIDLLRIEEVRKKPVINILDVGDIIEKHVKPARRRIVMINTFLGFIISFVIVILKERMIENNFIGLLKDEFKKK